MIFFTRFPKYFLQNQQTPCFLGTTFLFLTAIFKIKLKPLNQNGGKHDEIQKVLFTANHLHLFYSSPQS
jgi:hypothetical protein